MREGFFYKERRRFDARVDAMDTRAGVSDIRFVLPDAPRGRQTCGYSRRAHYHESAVIHKVVISEATTRIVLKRLFSYDIGSYESGGNTMKWKWMALLCMLLLLAACGAETVEEFHYTDHRGEQLSNEDLEGTPWLATFVFTNCETVCPPMTFNMADLQKDLESNGLSDYKIVAFSVDPNEDTPEKMQEYLSHYPISDESKWHLLTGYSQDEIAEFATENFKSLVKNDPNSDQVIHGTSFYLVDQKGEVVGNYDGFEQVPTEKIIKDMQELSQ